MVSNGAQLAPFPIDRPVMPIDGRQFPIGQPPSLPNDTIPFPNLSLDALRVIASQLANLIKARANGSTAHMFVYNEQSANNWYNPQFFLTVNYTYYHMAIGIAKGFYVEGNKAMEESIKNILSALTTIAITRFGNIASSVSRDLLQQAQANYNNVVAMFNEITQETGRIRAQMQQQYQQPQQQYYQQPGMPMPGQPGNMGQAPFGYQPNMAPPVSQAYNPYQGQQYQNPNQNRQAPGTGVFHNTNQPNNQGQTVQSNTFSKYAYLSANKPVQPQPQYQPQQAFNSSPTTTQAGYRPGDADKSNFDNPQQAQPMESYSKPEIDWEGTDTSSIWRPSLEQPYPIAVNSRTEVRVATKTYGKNGSVSGVIYSVREPYELGITEEKMDRNRHYITPVTKRLNTFEPPAKPIDVNFISKPDENGVTHKTVVKQPGELLLKKTNELNSAVIKDPLYMEEFFFAAQSMAKQAGDKDTGYFLSGNIKKTLVSKDNYIDLLKRLANCNTFAQLGREMQLIVGNTDSSKDLLELIASLDNYLKKKLLAVLRYRMGVTSITIDSFMEDAPQLFSFLNENHGESYRDALQSKQKEFITNYFNPELSENHVNYGNSEEEMDSIYVYNLVETASVTCVDTPADKLNINMIRNMANAVTENSLPELHLLIDSVTSDVDDEGKPYSSNYLITTDGEIFEVFKGYIGNSTFASCLIRQVVI